VVHGVCTVVGSVGLAVEWINLRDTGTKYWNNHNGQCVKGDKRRRGLPKESEKQDMKKDTEKSPKKYDVN
jgi:hypothetical protein